MTPINPLLMTDSYKLSHPGSYPPGTASIFSYLESRGGRYAETTFFGLQYLLKEYMTRRITMDHVDEAEARWKAHGEPFPREGWERVVRAHDGRIPLRIRAVAEGSVVPVSNVLMTFETTDPDLHWMGSWWETLLMRQWYGTTVCTVDWHIAKKIRQFLIETADDPEAELPFKLHDFGGRGVSSAESAGVGGMSHLVNFMGTDTMEGIEFARRYYGEEMAGFSIPAMEHSTVIAWGRDGGGELRAFRNFVERNAALGHKIIACVSDSYDIFNAVENIWCEADGMLDTVKRLGVTLVVRPDSGDPVDVNLRLLRIMERKLGMRTNAKGYKVLPTFEGGGMFRLIQGDGNDDEESIAKILRAMKAEGYSASNIAFGMGGGLLQKVDRDTQKFALKSSEITMADGTRHAICKTPVTDLGKRSKAGRLDLVRKEGRWQTVVADEPRRDSELVTVFENGEIKREWTFKEVRARAREAMVESMGGA
jgi:nicotinamide phosphoribosyltransferase